MNKQLYIRNVNSKGRGVFCKTIIHKDEVFDLCPVIVLPDKDREIAASSKLADYFFNFIKEEGTMALVLGFGSLYNHAKNCNAGYRLHHETKIMGYYALEDISAGTEICINYAGERGNEYKEWFESRYITYRES